MTRDSSQDFESLLEYWSNMLSVAVERNRLLILIALLDSESSISEEVTSHRPSTTTSSLTFTQLQAKTKLKKNSLNYHLATLQSIGLIKTRKRKPYEITAEGKRLLISMGITKELIITFQKRPK